MIKSLKQLLFFLHSNNRIMNSQLKNLKISPEIHTRLKIEAAKSEMPLTEYANLLLTLAMYDDENINNLRARLIDSLKRNV